MKKTELLTAIKAVMMGIDKGSAIGSDFLLFDENWVRSFKEDISVSFPLETKIRTAVRAEELYKILGKLSGDELEIELAQGGGVPDKLIVTSGKTTIKMNPLQKEQTTASLEKAWAVQTDDLEWFFLPKGFQEGLELCSFSAGVGAALGALAGVHFLKNNAISTDNFRVSVYTMEEEVPDKFTIPTRVVENLIRLGVTFESIALSKAWVHFSNKEGAIFSSRILAGEYPSDKILGLFKTMKFDMGEIAREFPKGLEAPLERAKILAGAEVDGWESLSQIALSYSNGHLNIQASKEAGEIIDQIEWPENHIEEDIELKVQPDFFKKILGITRQFRMSPTKKSLLFSSDKFKHLMVATLK